MGEFSPDHRENTCHPIDLHVTKLETELEEEKKKPFSIDSILGREDLEDSRIEDTTQSLVFSSPPLSSSSSLIDGTLF